ncbi:MAG: tRNA pseudouridine(55) synthase [Flavobacteriaceae bacterium]|jgi:tRNA pseudouridine(55) synthase
MQKARRISPNIYMIYKQKGLTPLEALEAFREKESIDISVKMTYAGRLDPLAEGLMLILWGEKCKDKELYMNKEKEYRVNVLLGVQTDTGDVMGKILQNTSDKNAYTFSVSEISKKIEHLKGKREQTYPQYSSKTVQGKPLWLYMKEDKVVELPSHSVTIKDIEILDIYKREKDDVISEIKKDISSVVGDFRQEDIIKEWEKSSYDGEFSFITIKVHCSSGTYMRVLAEEIGGALGGIPACAYSIERTNIFLK